MSAFDQNQTSAANLTAFSALTAGVGLNQYDGLFRASGKTYMKWHTKTAARQKKRKAIEH